MLSNRLGDRWLLSDTEDLARHVGSATNLLPWPHAHTIPYCVFDFRVELELMMVA